MYVCMYRYLYDLYAYVYVCVWRCGDVYVDGCVALYV